MLSTSPGTPVLGDISRPEEGTSRAAAILPHPGRGDVLRVIKVSIFPLTGIAPYQTIIISANPSKQELIKNTQSEIFIYQRIDIDCLAENDNRESLSGYRDEDQV